MRLLHLAWTHLPLRLEGARRPLPLGPLVIGGQPWEPGSVLDADPAAVRLGVHTGQPLTVAGRLAPEATFLPADPGAWRSALEQALEVVAGFCPAVEAEVEPGRPGFGRILLGIEGLDRLWGDEPILVARLADALALILPGSPLAGIANTRFGAAVAAVAAAPAAGERLALAGSPPLIAAPAGNAAVEAAFLAPRPIRLLTADLEIRERFRLFGLTRIGDLAQLARSAVVARFGARGGELHDLARGLDGRPLVPRRPVERLRAEAELEPPVETLDPLRFVLHRLTGALCDQLAARGTGAARAILVLDLASGSRLRLDQALPEPVARAELIERLLVARLEAEHPAEPVGRIGLELDGRAPEAGIQLGLFTPQSAQADRLAWQLAGLDIRFGSGRLWRATLRDPEASLAEDRICWRPAIGDSGTGDPGTGHRER